MAVAVIGSSTGDGYLITTDAVYAAARSGSGFSGGLNALTAGQIVSGNYFLWEGFTNFDLFAAGISASNVASAVTLELWPTADNTTTDFNIEARSCDWGATLEVEDWVAGASLSGKTLLASRTTTGLSIGAYVTITESGTALKDAVNVALLGDGVLRVVICSSRMTAGTAPSDSEYVDFSSSQAPSQSPKLTVTHAAAVAPAKASGFRSAAKRNRRTIGRRLR